MNNGYYGKAVRPIDMVIKHDVRNNLRKLTWIEGGLN